MQRLLAFTILNFSSSGDILVLMTVEAALMPCSVLSC